MTLPPFTSYSGSRSPRLLIIGEAWGDSEEQTGGIPFCGKAGAELMHILLEVLPHNRYTNDLHFAMTRSGWHQMREVWAKEAQIGFTNTVNFKPVANDFNTLLCSKKELPNDYPQIPPFGKGSTAYLKPEYLGELTRLRSEIAEAAPNCVVPVGAVPTWAVLGRSDISNVRGTATLGAPTGVCSGVKVVPTYHPSAIIRGRQEWRIICIADFMKAWRESENRTLVRPERQVIVNPTLDEVKTFSSFIQRGATFPLSVATFPLSVDCETSGSLITCISFADSKEYSITIPFRAKDGTRNYWPTLEEEFFAWTEVRAMLECGRPLLFQNGMYDMQFLIRMGFNMKFARDDTMLLHHSLYPEVQKSLGFLGSIYTNESSWKLLRKQRTTKIKGDKLDE